MYKDFDRWNNEKKNINRSKSLLFAEGDIWSCHLGVNVGFEQDGKRLEYRMGAIGREERMIIKEKIKKLLS